MIGGYEKLVLASICKAVNISKSGHVPKQYFMKKFQNDKRAKKQAEKAFRTLIARGYVSPHPTRGEMTYHLTAAGLDVCREIFKKH
jgi:predicted GNAT superfamily acetyltransferase